MTSIATTETPRRDTAQAKRTISVLIIPLYLSVLLAHLPLLVALGQRLWATEHYQFFPLILFGSAIIGYRRLRKFGPLQPGLRKWSVLLFASAALILSAAVLLDSPWLGGVAAMASLWALIYASGGRDLARRLTPAWLFLWLAIPLPLGLDEQLIIALQRVATDWASGLLDLLGFRHVVAGVVIEMPGASFLVEEACSGIHSLFAALSCTVFYSIYYRRGFWRTLILAATAVFWVLIANIARVTAVPILSTSLNIPVTEGLGHELLGILVFATSLALVVSTDRLFMFLVPPRSRTSTMPNRGKSRRWRDLLWRKSRRKRSDKTKKHSENVPGNATERQVEKKQTVAQLRRGAIIVTLCYGCIALWQAIAVGRTSRAANPDLQIRHLRSAQKGLLPGSWHDWQCVGFESITRQEEDPNGQISQQWRYQRDDQTIVVSIDGPFVGWHSLGNCLVGQGWEIQERVTSNYRDHGDDLAGGCAELQTKKGLNRYAFVVYATFDAANRPLTPPDTYVQFRAVRRFPQLSQLLKRIAGHDDESIGRDDVMAYQLQVFAEHAVPLSDGQREQIRELFHEFRRIVTGL